MKESSKRKLVITKRKNKEEEKIKKDMVLTPDMAEGKKPCGRKNALAEALIVVCTIMVLVLEVELALHHHHVD